MKILLLSQFFSSTRGGGEYVFSLIAKNLAKNNHNVWVITNKIENEEYETYKNIKMIFVQPTLEYKGGLPPGFFDNLRYSINAINTGRTIIKKEKIDLIHSNNFAPAFAGSMLSFLTSKPHITTIHDVFSLCGKNYWKLWGAQSNVSKINVMLAPFFEKLLIKLRYNCIHTVSEASKDDLVKFGAKKPIYVIHNAIDEETPQLIEERGPQLQTNPFQFVYVGRLVFYKNLEVAIKAISIAKKTEPKIKLVIVGGGPHQKSLEELTRKLQVESNVEFKGYVNSNEKTKIIAQSGALVFPSLCEGFGLVILEAFSQKKPVLVSDVRPMSDIVKNGVTGCLLDPNDENAWANQLLDFVKNISKASCMGQNGNKHLHQSFSQEMMYQKMMKMYNDQV